MVTEVDIGTTLLDKHLSEGTHKFTYGQAQEIILDYTKHLLRKEGLSDIKLAFHPTQVLLAAAKRNRIFLSSAYLDNNFLENNGHIDVNCIVDMICAGSHSRTHLSLNREFKRENFDHDKTSLMKENLCVILAPEIISPYLSYSNTEIIARSNTLKTRKEITSKYNLPLNNPHKRINTFNTMDVELLLKGREFFGKSSDVSHAALNFLMLFNEKDPGVTPRMLKKYPNLAFEFNKDGVRHTYREVLKIKEQQLAKHPEKTSEIESYFYQMIVADPLLHAQFIASISGGSTSGIRDVMKAPAYIEDENILHVLKQESTFFNKEATRLLSEYKKAKTPAQKAKILQEAGDIRKQISNFARSMDLVICRRESPDSLNRNLKMLLKLSSCKNECYGTFVKLVKFGELEKIPITADLRGDHNYPMEPIKVGPNPFYQPKPFGLR